MRLLFGHLLREDAELFPGGSGRALHRQRARDDARGIGAIGRGRLVRLGDGAFGIALQQPGVGVELMRAVGVEADFLGAVEFGLGADAVLLFEQEARERRVGEAPARIGLGRGASVVAGGGDVAALERGQTLRPVRGARCRDRRWTGSAGTSATTPARPPSAATASSATRHGRGLVDGVLPAGCCGGGGVQAERP